MKQKDGISLSEFLSAIFKRWYVTLVTILVAVAISGIFAFVVVTPKYRSTAEIMVQPPKHNGEYDLNVANKISETVAYHFQTDLVLEHVVEALEDPNITVPLIKNSLNVTYKTTMFYMNISVSHQDNILSKTIAQQVVDSGQELANNGRVPLLEDSFIKISDAKLGIYVSPNKTLYLITGFLIGALIGATIVFFIEISKFTFRDKESIESELNIELIGVIPKYDVLEKSPSIKGKRGKK